MCKKIAEKSRKICVFEKKAVLLRAFFRREWLNATAKPVLHGHPHSLLFEPETSGFRLEV